MNSNIGYIELPRIIQNERGDGTTNNQIKRLVDICCSYDGLEILFISPIRVQSLLEILGGYLSERYNERIKVISKPHSLFRIGGCSIRFYSIRSRRIEGGVCHRFCGYRFNIVEFDHSIYTGLESQEIIEACKWR